MAAVLEGSPLGFPWADPTSAWAQGWTEVRVSQQTANSANLGSYVDSDGSKTSLTANLFFIGSVQAFSISFWFNSRSITGSGECLIMSDLVVEKSSSGKVKFCLPTVSGSPAYLCSETGVLSSSAWHQVTITFDSQPAIKRG